MLLKIKNEDETERFGQSPGGSADAPETSSVSWGTWERARLL